MAVIALVSMSIISRLSEVRVVALSEMRIKLLGYQSDPGG